jgi:hypothetical protein
MAAGDINNDGRLDVNNDGRLDVVVATNDGPALVLMNQASHQNHGLSLNLVGVNGNRDGIGARVKVVTDEGEQFSTITTATSCSHPGDKRVHFAVDAVTMVQRIEVFCPSRTVQVLSEVGSDQFLTITEAGSGK